MTSRATWATRCGVFGAALSLLLLLLALFALPSAAISAPYADSVLGVPASAGHANTPPALAEWGTHGSGPGQFDRPLGIAVDSVGNVYIADERNNRVQKFTTDGGFLTQWGTFGFDEGQFAGIQRIAVDAFGSLYVCDYNGRIQKFDDDGTFIIKWGRIGDGDGEFDGPHGIAVDASGNVYVVDRYHCRVQKFTATGGFLGKWGSRGSGDGQFKDPTAIAVAPSGHVYVVDAGNSRVEEFGPDGDFLNSWGSLGHENGQFAGAFGVAVDRAGRVYVADTNNDRIQVFTPGGAFITTWRVTGGDPNVSRYTSDIAVDASGNVYVIDLGQDFVKKYGPIKSSTDGTPPTTKVHDADDKWHRKPVTLTFTATDNAGGSGVDFTEYTIGGGGWTQGTQATVPAPADHKGDGPIKVRFRSVDRAGNVERYRSVTVLIDTEEPVVFVQRTNVIKGRRVIVRFEASDLLSPKLRVVATVETSSGTVLHRAKSSWLTRKGLNGWSFIADFPKGYYEATIVAYDLAGNKSPKEHNWLVVQ